MRLQFLILFISVLIFAVIKEISDSNHCYIECIPKEVDSFKKLCKKLDRCLEYNKVYIKWRRSAIYAIISTFFIFGLVYFRVPEPKELILFVFILYIVYYFMWVNFVHRVGDMIEHTGKNIIKGIKRKIK